MLILGSAGVPEHWFAEGGNVNRATAEAMDTPTFRNLKRRQAFYRDAIAMVLQHQIDQAIVAGRLPRKRYEFEVIPPDVSSKDASQLIQNLRDLTDTLVSAVEARFTDREQARGVWASQASELGIEVEKPTQQALDDDKGEEEAAAEEIEASPYKSLESRKKRKRALQTGRRVYASAPPSQEEIEKAKRFQEEKRKADAVSETAGAA